MLYRMEDGEKFIGEFVHYRLSGDAQSNTLYLESTPMCAEIAEKVRVAQKQRRGRVFSMVEIVFFGLGLMDAAKSQAVVEASKEVTPLAKYKTGEVVVCGEKEPAADKMIVLEDKQREFYREVETDAQGRLNLNKVLADQDRILQLTIRLASEPTKSLSFLYTPN